MIAFAWPGISLGHRFVQIIFYDLASSISRTRFKQERQFFLTVIVGDRYALQLDLIDLLDHQRLGITAQKPADGLASNARAWKISLTISFLAIVIWPDNEKREHKKNSCNG